MREEMKEIQTQVEQNNLEIDRLREQIYQQNLQMSTTNINETTKEVL